MKICTLITTVIFSIATENKGVLKSEGIMCELYSFRQLIRGKYMKVVTA